MHIYLKLFVACIIVLHTFSLGCTTMLRGSTENIEIASTPEGATIIENDVEVGKTPCTLKVDRKTHHIYLVKHEGHQPAEIVVRRKNNHAIPDAILGGALLGLAIVPGLVYIVTAAAINENSGASYDFYPKKIDVDLTPSTTDNGTLKILN